MDENKREKLHEVGYAIRETCASCRHSQGLSWGESFGTCAKFTYTHRKHTGPDRQLSIHRSGWCPAWSESETGRAPVSWKEFNE